MQLDYHCSVVSVSCYGSWLHETDETAVIFCSRIKLERLESCAERSEKW